MGDRALRSVYELTGLMLGDAKTILYGDGIILEMKYFDKEGNDKLFRISFDSQYNILDW